MQVTVDENNVITLTGVFNPIKMISTNGDELYISMRDGGFEFVLNGENVGIGKFDLNFVETTFKESRLTHPMIGFKYSDFNEFINEKLK